ncbi:MAG: Hpt domain-containing protein [Bdellovibrionota bacterium]
MSSVDDIELRKAFFTEAVDILDRLDADIEALAEKPEDMAVINSLFRALHTIKGNSSFLNLEKVTALSHNAEALLDKARKQELAVVPALVELIREVAGSLRVMIVEQDFSLDISSLINGLQSFGSGKNPAPATALAAEKKSQPASESATLEKKVVLNSVVRVDEVKINRILGLVSELEILRYSLERMPGRMDTLGPAAEEIRFDLDLQLSKLSRLTRSLSGIVFGVRLVPVNQVFQRFPRVVQDLAKRL